MIQVAQRLAADAGIEAGEPHDPTPGEPWSELGYARRLIHLHGDELRYVPAWHRWLVWDGRRWDTDSTGQADRWMKAIARRVTDDARLITDDRERKQAITLARRGESSAWISGALTLAGTEHGIALTRDQLDADPWLLNCANGVLDLRTGELGPHDPALHLTRLTGAGYDPEAVGEEFTRFLEKVQPDKDMRAFLARLLGHSLPGVVIEHLLPIMWGTGQNGKSTLLETVASSLGDYAGTTDPALFIELGYERHPTGQADLFGRRLVVVHESDRGRYLAEATVKRLTGGDPIKARRVREDFWEFQPSHTAIMVTNHPPVVRGTDEGIWRRLRLVPWDVVIPAKDRDRELKSRLRRELDAVLAWLATGYWDWHMNGLDEPHQVVDATAGYRRDSDLLGRFLADRCEVGGQFSEGSTRLWAAWQSWCQTESVADADRRTQTSFAADLKKRGLFSRKDATGRMRWNGVALM